jgi:hypothetical protein
MEFLRVGLQVPSSNRRAVTHFYATTLGLGSATDEGHGIGATTLVFEPHAGTPFYHFAILLPGDRFTAAQTWARQRVELLGGAVHFAAWRADSVYFHDPVGNIVELIAHHGQAENGRHGEFSPAEFVGLSEIGLVGDVGSITADLARLELDVCAGAGTDLVFVGEPTGTVIVAATGRGWLPLDRPAETHPVHVTVAGAPKGVVRTAGHAVRRVG